MARMTPMQRLTRRGIIAVQVDGVLARFTRAGSEAVRAAPSEARLHAEARLRAVAALAVAVRQRVKERGDLAGQAPAKVSKRKVYLPPEYVTKTTLGPGDRPTLGRVFGRTADMYAELGRRPETYDVSGGMWSGLQARAVGSGGDQFILDFTGTSDGRGKPVFAPRTDGHPGKRLARIEAPRVRNQWKAGAIFDQQQVHVLLPEQPEADTLAVSVAAAWERAIVARLG